jgi:hypothetical protein
MYDYDSCALGFLDFPAIRIPALKLAHQPLCLPAKGHGSGGTTTLLIAVPALRRKLGGSRPVDPEKSLIAHPILFWHHP